MRKSLAAFLFVLSTLAFAAPAKPPCLVSMNVPKYPPLARTARVQGTVIVKIVINEKGEVTSVTEVSGHPLLKEAAISNAKHGISNLQQRIRRLSLLTNTFLTKEIPTGPAPISR